MPQKMLTEIRRERRHNDRQLRGLREKLAQGGRNTGATRAAYNRRRARLVELVDRERELLAAESAHDRSLAIAKLRAYWPTIAKRIERGDSLASVRDYIAESPTHHYGGKLTEALDELDIEIARGDFDDPAVALADYPPAAA